jgi:thiosulfate/3-mercaptopyruvate sulfurtransferase
MFTGLISAEELHAQIQPDSWVIVDCRFDLADPNWGFQGYQEGHIPGAVYAHLDHDLAGPITPDSGRHPLPTVDDMASRIGSWGISDTTQVVVYDTSGGAYAVRLWWLLRFLGHAAVAVLNGGFQKWQQAGLPIAVGIEQAKPAAFIPRPDWSMVADADEVERIRQSANHMLIDARAAERYRGEREPIDPVAGHIPGAVNRFHGMNLGPDGLFLSPAALRAQFKDLVGQVSPENVVVYCGSGVTSIHHILAMEIAGLPGARLYPGSWSEWIRDKKRPVA